MPSLHATALIPFLAESRAPLYFLMTIPIVGMIFALLVVALTAHFRDREQLRRHETARLALEKGQAIPVFSDAWNANVPRPARQRSWVGLMIGGFVNLAVGVGAYIMLCSIQGAYEARWFGMIPGLIGVALLLSALIVGLTSRTPTDSGDPPPVS